MVDKLSEALIYSNKLTNGILPIDVNDGIFNISIVDVSDNKHYLRIQDMNGDRVFISEQEPNKSISEFIDYSTTPSDKSLSERFLAKFIGLQGRIYASEYTEQNSLMLKFEYSFSDKTKKLLYACSLDEKETNNIEKRDKVNSVDVIPNQGKPIVKKVEDQVTNIDNLNKESSKSDLKNDYLAKIRKTINDYEFIKAKDLLNEYENEIGDPLTVLGLKAEIYNHQRRSKECITLCDDILSKDKDNVKAKSEKALALRQYRKYDEALVLINQAITQEPENERHYFIKAFNLNCKGLSYNKEALQVINQALTINPNYSAGLSIKALIFSEMKEYDKAIVLFDKAIMLDPKNSFAYNHKGLYYKSLGKDDKSKEFFELAIKVDPYFSVAHDNLGDYYMSKYKYEEAQKCFENAVQNNPDNTHALTNLAKCLNENKKPDEAMKWIDKAIENEPDYPWALDLKGTLLFDKKMYAESVKFFEKAVSFRPEHPDFITNLGWAYLNSGNSSDAYDQFILALDIDPSNYSAEKGKDKIMREC